jgi:hypothetical protein
MSAGCSLRILPLCGVYLPRLQQKSRVRDRRQLGLRCRITDGPPLNIDPAKSERKSQIDALLLKLPGVSARKINGLDAYFVSDKMFACISGDGVGLRLPATTATELQFSRDNVVPFSPGGMASTREWIQINRADAAEYEKDLDLFQASLDFVKTGRSR